MPASTSYRFSPFWTAQIMGWGTYALAKSVLSPTAYPAAWRVAVHPELVKRIVVTDTVTGKSVLQNMGASALVNGTRRGYGKSTPKERQRKEVTILDIFGNAASAKAGMAEWIDYMQLARIDGRWVIVNVLWERGPG
jgi:hypothetical protein